MRRAPSKCSKDGVLIGIPPNLWYMRDTDGDLKADTREKVNDTYGRGGNIEHDANSLLWAMDNIMYSSEHTWDLEVEERQVRIAADDQQGPVADHAG